MKMKQHILFSILILFCIGCDYEMPLDYYEEPSKNDSCERNEIILAKMLGGIPLVVPIYCSEPSVFLIPVSSSKEPLFVDNLYLYEYDGIPGYERKLYKLERIVKVKTDDNTWIIAIGTSIYNGIQKFFEIDGFSLRQLRLINDDKWEFRSRVCIDISEIKGTD